MPSSVRTLLANAVQDSLGVMKDERHACQSSCVQMIGEALAGLEKARQGAIDEVQGKINGAEAEMSSRTAAKTAAETALNDLVAGGDAAKAALDADTNAAKSAVEGVKAAKVAQKEGDAAADKSAGCKEMLEKLQGQVAELKDQEQGCDQKTISSIVAAGKQLGFDGTLLSMVPETLKRKKEVRGTFDTMAFDSLQAEIAKHLAKVIADLADPVAARAQRQAAVEAAESAQEAAAKRKDEAVTAVANATKAVKDGRTALSAAKDAVAVFEREMSGHAKELENANRKLSNLQDGAMAAYRELVDLAPPPPPPAHPEPEAATAAAVQDVAPAAPLAPAQ